MYYTDKKFFGFTFLVPNFKVTKMIKESEAQIINDFESKFFQTNWQALQHNLRMDMFGQIRSYCEKSNDKRMKNFIPDYYKCGVTRHPFSFYSTIIDFIKESVIIKGDEQMKYNLQFAEYLNLKALISAFERLDKAQIKGERMTEAEYNDLEKVYHKAFCLLYGYPESIVGCR